ncbi:MAG: hypothetical protein ACHQPI_12595 [Thermoanaerobaculia bacterium]
MHTGRRLALGFLVVSGLALPARFSMGANVWTIPGTANVAGQNGTRFVSDLAVTNAGTVPAQLTISLVPAGGTTPNQVTLNGGETVVYRNLLDRLWGAQGSGATQVSSDVPLVIRGRTYNTAASGTFGVALPVFADEQLLSLGDTGDSLWISQSADGSSGYRTNVAVVFPDDGGGAATVTIFDADGNQIGTRDYGLDAPGFQQFSVSSFAGAVSVGRAEIVVTRGRAAGYAVVNDNVTGDGSLFIFEDLPAGFQDVVLNGVARTPGRANTFFRTDGRFYNPGSEDATVTVAFHAQGASNPTPATASFTVPAGKIVEILDLLRSLLGLPDGSAGALRFKSATPVGVLGRTSNVDPSGANAGTFGAQQRPVPLMSFLMSADAGAIITGIRQNASFRTNVGFAAGEDGASYALTLKNTAGATVASATRSLGSFGWEQPSIASVFSGTGIPDDAQLVVKVVSGSVDVFDSSIDNLSGDSVVTPAAPLSVDLPSSATIGPAGGSIRSVDGVMTLKIPAGALSAPVAIGLAQAPNDAPGGVGSGYDISPDGLVFAKPALFSLSYGPSGLDVPEIDSLTLAIPSGASWSGFTGGRIDTGAKTLTISLPGTSASSASSLPTGRTAYAGSGASRHVVLRGLEINTLLRSWVITDGTITNILPVLRLPPSGTGETPQTYLISELNLDPSNVTFFPPRIGTISRSSTDEFTYTAPHSIAHATVPVKMRLRAQVTRGAGIPFGLYETSKIFHVVRRRWVLNVEFGFLLPCAAGSGNEDYAYSYADNQTQGFHLEDDPAGLLLKTDPFLAGLPADAVLTSCKCVATLLGEPGTITFSISDGSLVLARQPYFQIGGQAGILNMIPAIKEVCPNPVPPPDTQTIYNEPFGPYSFDLFLGLSGVGGLRPSDGTVRFIIMAPPILTITVEWHSVNE